MWFWAAVSVAAIVAAGVLIRIATLWGEIAERKGYNKRNWTIAAFFIGLPVRLLVIALPDVTPRK
ncbi:MAG: hypothetical protein LBS90_06045 [Oscillospiraceae bacterium]|jgi:hypothetical protein|nr:hypothetical protein [Oscillospiraceae bacterium]